MEDYNFIYPVNEFGAEGLFQLTQHLSPHLLVALLLSFGFVLLGSKTHSHITLDEFNTNIAGHNDHSILKVYRPPVTIG